MTETAEQTRPEGPVALAEGLLETLTQEREALVQLGEMFASHREALRDRRRDLLDAATDDTNETVSRLAQLRQTRDRKLRLLGRVLRLEEDDAPLQQAAERIATFDGGAEVSERLLEVRDEIRAQAPATKQQCDDLEFALQYALDLGRDLIQAVQGLDAPANSSQYYTSKGGRAESPHKRSFLNKLG